MSNEAELEFVIESAAPPVALDPERLRTLSAGLDWERATALADFHRVRPVFRRRALDLGFGSAQQRAEWEAGFRSNALRNMALMSGLVAVTRALQAAGIPVLPHKGPLLALAAYGDLAWREFADLDILVPADHLAGALEVLAEMGYRRDADLAWLSAAALRRWTGEAFCGSDDDVGVDLHWRLTPPHYPVQLEADRLWSQVGTLRVAGAELPTLRQEALSLLLAVHGAKHHWEAVGWLADLAWLAAGEPRFDWDLALALADGFGNRRVLLVAATLLRDVFRTRLPVGIGEAIRADPQAEALAQRVRRRWREGPLEPPRSPELLAFAAGLSISRAATARHLYGLIFDPTERDWRTRRLPEPLFGLYAPGRGLRLAWKYLSPGTGK